MRKGYAGVLTMDDDMGFHCNMLLYHLVLIQVYTLNMALALDHWKVNWIYIYILDVGRVPPNMEKTDKNESKNCEHITI